jgi:hypothetical protein
MTGEQLPEKTVLYCDAEDGEVGEWVEIVVGGRRVEAIVCAAHRAPLDEIASWGRPVRGPRTGQHPRGAGRKPRDTSPRRLADLMVDESEQGRDGAS